MYFYCSVCLQRYSIGDLDNGTANKLVCKKCQGGENGAVPTDPNISVSRNCTDWVHAHWCNSCKKRYDDTNKPTIATCACRDTLCSSCSSTTEYKECSSCGEMKVYTINYDALDLIKTHKPICKICLNRFTYKNEDHYPWIIQCGHTLCSQCLGKILGAHNLKLAKKLTTTFSATPKTCPFCLTRIQVVLTNRHIEDMLNKEWPDTIKCMDFTIPLSTSIKPETLIPNRQAGEYNGLENNEQNRAMLAIGRYASMAALGETVRDIKTEPEEPLDLSTTRPSTSSAAAATSSEDVTPKPLKKRKRDPEQQDVRFSAALQTLKSNFRLLISYYTDLYEIHHQLNLYEDTLNLYIEQYENCIEFRHDILDLIYTHCHAVKDYFKQQKLKKNNLLDCFIHQALIIKTMLHFYSRDKQC